MPGHDPRPENAARHRRGVGVELLLRVDAAVLELIDREAEQAGVPNRTVVERAIRAQLGSVGTGGS